MASPSKTSTNSKYSGSPWGVTPKNTVYAVVVDINDNQDLVRVGKITNVRYTKSGWDTSYGSPVKVKGFNLKLKGKSHGSKDDPDGTWYFFREDMYKDSFDNLVTNWKLNTSLNAAFQTRKKRIGTEGKWLKTYYRTEAQETQDPTLDESTDYCPSPASSTNPAAFTIGGRAKVGGKSPRLNAPTIETGSQLLDDKTDDQQGNMNIYLHDCEKCSYMQSQVTLT